LQLGGIGVGDVEWTFADPGRLRFDDDVYVIASLDAGETTWWFRMTEFKLSLPVGASPVGVEVKIIRKASVANTIKDLVIDVRDDWPNNIPATGKEDGDFWDTAEEEITYGGPVDIWGFPTLSKAEVEDDLFGVFFRVENDHVSATSVASIDRVCLRVYFTL